MGVRLHVFVFDSDDAAKYGKPAEIGFDLHGMTTTQAEAALAYLRPFTRKLEIFINQEADVKKYGDKDQGRIIPESEAEQKTAAANFTEEDERALIAEQEDVIEGVGPV